MEGDSMAIWKPYMSIKNQETCEIEITEKIGNSGKVKRKVKIQNGKVIEKPRDVIILGKETPDGFIIEGLQLRTKRRKTHLKRS